MASSLLDFLVAREIITEEERLEVIELAERRKIQTPQALLESGYAGDTPAVIKILADAMGFEFFDLSLFDVGKGGLSSLLTSTQAKAFPAITLYEEEGELLVAIPLDLAKSSLQAKEDIKRLLSEKKIKFVVGTRKDILKAIDKAYRIDQELSSLSSKRTKGEYLDPQAILGSDVPDTIESESEVVKFVDLVLAQSIKDGASDIHFDPTETKLEIRYRIDGILKSFTEAPKFMHPEIVSRIKILSGLDISQTRIPQDGRFSHYLEGKKIDVRMATLPSVFGEKVVMRVLNNSQASMPLKKLGFSDHNLERFRTAAKKPHGMVLVTGPTGSGKSTTLYSALNEIVTPEINVVTVEDPVEYQIPGITQIQVNNKATLTFERILRTILRADPDVILVGEIRDLETANIAMQAGLTGHMVFSTLHTNDAASAIPRLADMGVEPFVTSSTLEAVVSQRLVRKLCDKCKEAYVPSSIELKALAYTKPISEEDKFFKAKGCRVCGNTGYNGRIAIHEVLLNSDAIQEAILSNLKVNDITKIAVKEGMVTMRDDGYEKVARGMTSFEEVLRVII